MEEIRKAASYGKVFKQLVKYNLTKRRRPLILTILVTNRCNFDCAYCWVDPTVRKMKDMDYEQLCKIIDEFYEMGTRVIWIEGGEPLLRNDLGDVLDHIRSKGIVTEVVTNGWVAEQKMGVLAKADMVCFSIDGDEESHDKVRAKGSHKRLIASMKKAKEMGVRFRLHSVLSSYNMNKKTIDYLCDLAEEMGTNVTFAYAITPTQKIKTGRDNELHRFDEEKMKEMLKYMIELKKKGRPIFHTSKRLNEVINWRLNIHDIEFDKSSGVAQCAYGRLACFMDVNGVIYPCTKYFGDESKGSSVVENGVEKAWDDITKDLTCVSCGKLTELDRVLSLHPANILRMSKKMFLGG